MPRPEFDANYIKQRSEKFDAAIEGLAEPAIIAGRFLSRIDSQSETYLDQLASAGKKAQRLKELAPTLRETTIPKLEVMRDRIKNSSAEIEKLDQQFDAIRTTVEAGLFPESVLEEAQRHYNQDIARILGAGAKNVSASQTEKPADEPRIAKTEEKDPTRPTLILDLDKKSLVKENGLPRKVKPWMFEMIKALAEAPDRKLSSAELNIIANEAGFDKNFYAPRDLSRIFSETFPDHKDVLVSTTGRYATYQIMANIEIRDGQNKTQEKQSQEAPTTAAPIVLTEGEEAEIEPASDKLSRHEAATIAALIVLRNGAEVRDVNNLKIFDFSIPDDQLKIAKRLSNVKGLPPIRDRDALRTSAIDKVSSMMIEQNHSMIDLQDSDVKDLLTTIYVKLADNEVLMTHFDEFLTQPIDHYKEVSRNSGVDVIKSFIKLATNGLHRREESATTAEDDARQADDLEEMKRRIAEIDSQMPAKPAVQPIIRDVPSIDTIMQSPLRPEYIMPAGLAPREIIAEAEARQERQKNKPAAVKPPTKNGHKVEDPEKEEREKKKKEAKNSPWAPWANKDKEIIIHANSSITTVVGLSEENNIAIYTADQLVRFFNNMSHTFQERVISLGVIVPDGRGGRPLFTVPMVSLMHYYIVRGRNTGLQSREYLKMIKVFESLVDVEKKRLRKQPANSR